MSQLYDVFPEPPAGHPLFDVEAQKRLQQFRDLASSLHQWIKEQIVIMQVCIVLTFLIVDDGSGIPEIRGFLGG